MSTPDRVHSYNVGQLVALVATVLGTDGVTPVTPSYFAFQVKNPAGSIATFAYTGAGASANLAATGAFTADYTVATSGPYYVRAVATGLVQAAEEWTFLGKPSKLI